MVKATKNIIPRQKEVISLLKKNGVIRASVFGSFARRENKKTSDIDILVKLKGGKTLLDLISIERKLKNRLKRKIDLLTYDSIHPSLKENILKEKISLI